MKLGVVAATGAKIELASRAGVVTVGAVSVVESVVAACWSCLATDVPLDAESVDIGLGWRMSPLAPATSDFR